MSNKPVFWRSGAPTRSVSQHFDTDLHEQSRSRATHVRSNNSNMMQDDLTRRSTVEYRGFIYNVAWASTRLQLHAQRNAKGYIKIKWLWWYVCSIAKGITLLCIRNCTILVDSELDESALVIGSSYCTSKKCVDELNSMRADEELTLRKPGRF